MRRSWTPVERVFTSGTSDVFGVNARKKQEVRSRPRWPPIRQDAATPLSRYLKLCSCKCRRVPAASRLLSLETRSSRGCPYRKPGVYVLIQPGCGVLHDRQVLLLTSSLVTFGLSHTRRRRRSTASPPGAWARCCVTLTHATPIRRTSDSSARTRQTPTASEPSLRSRTAASSARRSP
jgi:hypothetical protein